MKPFAQNNEVVWQHIPSKRRSTWRLRALARAAVDRRPFVVTTLQ
jgi:hypothetical protein